MAITPKVLIAQQQAAAVQTTYYTAPTGARARIDKFTGTNTAASNVSISIWLVSSGGTAGNSNLIVDTKTIVPDECYLFPELVGQWLEPGSFIVAQASAATPITLRASGVEAT